MLSTAEGSTPRQRAAAAEVTADVEAAARTARREAAAAKRKALSPGDAEAAEHTVSDLSFVVPPHSSRQGFVHGFFESGVLWYD